MQTTANGVTRTMVYDTFGQLVADYNGATMERENIYRGGEVLAVYEAGSSCYMTVADFVTSFYVGALGRNPTSTELSDWTGKLSEAQAQGFGKLIKVAQDLGAAIFTTSGYNNGNSNNDYVTDLYEAYLQRAPDSGGLTSCLNALSNGSSRTDVRNGFAYSMEFQGNVMRLCPTGSNSNSTSANLKYVLTDAQGSARALMDNTGSGASAIVARHDYLPFGEEIWAGIGLRTTTQKYAATDKVRQHFATLERDEATGLDHTWFRKADSFAGRWTSPDALSGSVANPQSFNHYTYAANDPVNKVDPTGLFEDDWRNFNCLTRADMGIGVLDWAFGWQGPCESRGPLRLDEPGPRGGRPDRPTPAPKPKKDKDCSIEVNFNGESAVKVQGATVKNGEGEVNTTSGPIQGVGFTITGHVPTGDKIAALPDKPTESGAPGQWTLQQWVWSFGDSNTQTYGSEPTHQELSNQAPHFIDGNKFGWWDHPGMPSQGLPQNPLKWSVGKWKFVAKAVNGKKECSVSFFVNVTFDGTNWHYEYDKTSP